MVFINDNDNRCVSDVFGLDFSLILSKVCLLRVFASRTLFLFLFNFLSL